MSAAEELIVLAPKGPTVDMVMAGIEVFRGWQAATSDFERAAAIESIYGVMMRERPTPPLQEPSTLPVPHK